MPSSHLILPSSFTRKHTEQNGGRRPRLGTQITEPQEVSTTLRSPSIMSLSPRLQVQVEEGEKEEENGKEGAPWVEERVCVKRKRM